MSEDSTLTHNDESEQGTPVASGDHGDHLAQAAPAEPGEPGEQGEQGEQEKQGAAARHNRKTARGYVVSDKMDKTVVVEVEDRVKHALYGKVLRRTSRLKAHDENNDCGVGDRVLLMETRPLSATKRWRVARIVERAK